MISIRVLNLESDKNAKAAKYFENELQDSIERGQVAIQTVGRSAFNKCHKMGIPTHNSIKKAIQHFLKQDDFIVFVTDTTIPKSKNQKLLDEIKKVVNHNNFADRIYFSQEHSNATSKNEDLDEIVSKIQTRIETNRIQFQKEWKEITARFNKAFADTPEEEIIRDFEEALKEVRRERT